ncbi:MAG TPA: hypothetical protein VHD56_05425 [Tepidisphaeraceae bacterium]|nr:hypothetical protein [Tepidisphaeraceae bacterium]
MATQLISPLLLLAIAVLITLLAYLWEGVASRRRKSQLGELARQWGMQYSARDVLGLSDRIARHLPVLGASDVRVTDLIYRNEGAGWKFFFSAYYTSGVVRSKNRRRFVVSLVEPKHSGGEADWSSLRIAPEELSLIEQYRALNDASHPSISAQAAG